MIANNPMKTTLDGILNRALLLEQPADGFRVAVDTVLLASAVPAVAGQKVLDLGCGVGGAMLALACRVPNLSVTGLEIQPALARLARSNCERNALQAELHILQADATRLSSTFSNIFDHVMMNPPYHDAAKHDASAQESKRLANTEAEGDLPRWIASAAYALKDGGLLTLIHRADRRDEIVDCLGAAFGDFHIIPIAPKEDRPPKRVIARARKGAPKSLTTHAAFVLHNPDGSYTKEADAVLREIEALPEGAT